MAEIPRAAKGRMCPFFKADMSKTCHTCALWTQIRGKHPQTGELLDEWNCAFAIMPVLMLETSRQARSGAAATESFRNEVLKEQAATVAAGVFAALRNPNIPQQNLGASDKPLLEGTCE